jgi:hypothetical protein
VLISLAIIILALFSGRIAQAEDDPAATEEVAPVAATAEPDFPVIVLGRLVCMPCLLNEREGASDLCELMNHGHQILVDVAQDPRGNDLPAMSGEVLDYHQPPNSKGIVLAEKHHGRLLLVHGEVEGGRLRIDSVRPVVEQRGDAPPPSAG